MFFLNLFNLVANILEVKNSFDTTSILEFLVKILCVIFLILKLPLLI